MQRAARLFLAALVLISPCSGWPAEAASPTRFSTDRVEHAHRDFGDVRFVMGSGQAMKWLEMYVGGGLVAAFRDFDAQDVHASPDGNYFLAISNKAYSNFAYAVLDRGGHLLFSSPHKTQALNYCGRGAANNWYWIDAAKPVASFEVKPVSWASSEQRYLKSVTVRGCDGRNVQLGEAAEPRQVRMPGPGLRAGCDAGEVRAPSPAPVVPATSSDQEGRSSFFIGNTIANLRGLDPCFGSRTLTLIEGRRVKSTPAVPRSEESRPAETSPAR